MRTRSPALVAAVLLAGAAATAGAAAGMHGAAAGSAVPGAETKITSAGRSASAASDVSAGSAAAGSPGPDLRRLVGPLFADGSERHHCTAGVVHATTGDLLLVADRPADLVRAYRVDPTTGELTAAAELTVPQPAFVTVIAAPAE